jgi:hypothetical protein
MKAQSQEHEVRSGDGEHSRLPGLSLQTARRSPNLPISQAKGSLRSVWVSLLQPLRHIDLRLFDAVLDKLEVVALEVDDTLRRSWAYSS